MDWLRFFVRVAAVVCAAAAPAYAQTSSSITIRAAVPWATIYVDGQAYVGGSTFVWPRGSKHTVEFRSEGLPPAISGCVASIGQALQTTASADQVFVFGGWTDNNGNTVPSSDPVQIVTADPSITSLTATASSILYRVTLNLFNPLVPAGGQIPSCSPGNPGAPGVPPSDGSPGVVYIGQAAFTHSAVLYLTGAVKLNAFPYPGYAFVGWGNLGNPYLTSVNITAPLDLRPQFEPAQRVRFVTSPPGLQVVVDHANIGTLPGGDVSGCPNGFVRSPAPPPGIPALCMGDFDFAPSSVHLLGAPTSQRDSHGKRWAFDSWSIGGGQNSVYTTPQNVSTPAVITAKFLPAATITLGTQPLGLKLSVDGTTNWPGYSFSWGIGTTHTFSAPLQQTGKDGRVYVFRSWSNGGAAEQSYTVDPALAQSGTGIMAIYDRLDRIVVQSNPPGLTSQVDGAPCTTPCNVDRPAGAQIRISAPASIDAGPGSRYDLFSWSDGIAAEHAVTFDSDLQVITANYQLSHRLTIASDPPDAADLQISPASASGFYPDGASVTVTANAKPGYKFSKWTGDIYLVNIAATLKMTQPYSVLALFDKVPYVGPVGMINAAGTTPVNSVAPGSIVSIFGANLAPDTVAGPANPLSQTLAGVIVTVDDRLLPIMFVSPNQINAQMASNFPEGEHTFKISGTGQSDVTGSVTIARNAPGLFTYASADGTAYALALHADGSVGSDAAPFKPGEGVTIYGTGFGPCKRALVDGFPATGPPNPLTDTAALNIAATSAPVTWAGAAPAYAGIEIVQSTVPADVSACAVNPSGTVVQCPATLTVNGAQSNTVMLPVMAPSAAPQQSAPPDSKRSARQIRH